MNFSNIISNLTGLFLLMFLGYFLYHIHIFNDSFNKKISKFLLEVSIPALILNSVLQDNGYPPANEVKLVFLIAISMYLILPIIGFLLVKILFIPKHQSGLYIFMHTYSNVGFIGFPIMQSIYGNKAIFYTAIFNIIFNLSIYTLGVILVYNKSEHAPKMQLLTFLKPGVSSGFLAIIIYLFHISLPNFLTTPIQLLGNVTTPMAMLLIGATLATVSLKDVFSDLRIYIFLLFKQCIIPILLYPILKKVIPNEFLLGITFIMLLMPVANSSVIFATEYENDTVLAAKNVFLSTLFSLLTIPCLLYICLTYF